MTAVAGNGDDALGEILPSPRRAASPHIDRAIWRLTANVDELGRLCVGETVLDRSRR
jgi:hypothetical protein